MDLYTISKQELVEIFKETIEQQEQHIELFADFFQDDLMLDLLILKMNLQKYSKTDETEKINLDFGSDIKLVEGVYSKLRQIFSEIHPSLLRILGLAKVLEIRTKEIALLATVALEIENNINADARLPYSKQENISIFRLYDSVLTRFILHLGGNLHVFMNTTDTGLYLELKKTGEGSRPTPGKEIESFFNPNLKEIKARLLILKAEISEKSDWESGIKLFIPFPS